MYKLTLTATYTLTLNEEMNDIFTKPKYMKNERWKLLQRILLCTVPGYSWHMRNPHLQDKDGMNGMSALELTNVFSRCLRYQNLHKQVSGNWITEEARIARRGRWIGDIRRKARQISAETNVPFDKVFSMLFNRMYYEVMK